MEFLLEPFWASVWLTVFVVFMCLCGLVTRSVVPWLVLLAVPVALEVWSPVKPLTWFLLAPALWVLSHPWLSLGIVVTYLVAGVAVACLRWTKLVYDAREALDEAMRLRWPTQAARIKEGGEYRTPRGGSERVFTPYTPQEKQQKLSDAKKSLRREVMISVTGREEQPPQIGRFKARFFGWAGAWPFVGTWMLIDDPVRRFLNYAYRNLSGLLQGVSNRAFAGAATNVAEEEQP